MPLGGYRGTGATVIIIST